MNASQVTAENLKSDQKGLLVEYLQKKNILNKYFIFILETKNDLAAISQLLAIKMNVTEENLAGNLCSYYNIFELNFYAR